jgi:hypothetical protein
MSGRRLSLRRTNQPRLYARPLFHGLLSFNNPLLQYIAVHVRHGDFGGWCGDVPVKDCFAPLSVIARRVDEVQEELWTTKRIVVDRVIVTSDEQDPTWWDAVSELGWVRPDHSRTVEWHGEWYPILIDAAIQSGGLGFVGTDRSTVSLMARKRVATWHGGAVRTVMWGHPGMSTEHSSGDVDFSYCSQVRTTINRGVQTKSRYCFYTT